MEALVHIGFLGAGKIAESHSFALDVLNYYYPDTPKIRKIVIASPTPASRESFAERFGFREAFPPEKIWEQAIDTLFILGPNQVHTPQLLQAVQQKHIKRIYVEKPIGTNPKDIQALKALKKSNHGKLIMMGFQYLQKSALRQALSHWQKADFGELIHFRAEYLHSSYLDPNYRQSHTHRFAPMPMDGAAVDLGSHPLSLLVAFIGPTLKVKSAAVSGNFNDVPDHTDLCTTILLEDVNSGAVGTLVASRVSSGAGDYLSLELRGANGSLLFNTLKPDSYDTYLPGEGWRKHRVLSDYSPTSEFPGKHAPSGWMRALIHNHYLFLGGETGISFIPDLAHGIQVQQLLQQTADYAKK